MMTHFGATMTYQTFTDIIWVQVEGILARFEPLDRLSDPFVQEALAVSCRNRLIISKIPKTIETLYNDYIVPIDKACTQAIIQILQKIPGNATLAVDGATVLGSSHLLYTLSKGHCSIFIKAAQLGGSVHVVEAEVADGLAKIEHATKQYQTTITNIAVDNAVRAIMNKVIDAHALKYPQASPIVATRDPMHCIDLISKDSAKTPTMAIILRKALAVVTLVKTDKIAGILRSLKEKKEIMNVPAANHFPETRMHLSSDTLQDVIRLCPFTDVLRNEEQYLIYYNSSPTKRKASLDAAIDTMSASFCDQMKAAVAWFKVAQYAATMINANNFPLSGFYPVVVALRNGLNAVLNSTWGGRTFDVVLGENARPELEATISTRFNMDGEDPEGAKVGLLDPNQIWAYLLDPFNYLLPFLLLIEGKGGMTGQVRRMATFFIKKETNTTDVEHDRMIALVIDEWKELANHEGKYAHSFPRKAEPQLDDVLICERQKGLTLDQVSKWVKETGDHSARLRFFTGLHNSVFIDKIVKTLLSIRSTGSISVERFIKPLKNKILTKTRNGLQLHKREVLLRVGLNLRCLRIANDGAKPQIENNFLPNLLDDFERIDDDDT